MTRHTNSTMTRRINSTMTRHTNSTNSVVFVDLPYSSRVKFSCGLLLGISEVLRSLRHHPRAQSQGHHTIDRLEERGVERESARRSSLKGRERAIVQSDEHLNHFTGNVWETSERRNGSHNYRPFLSHRYCFELN